VVVDALPLPAGTYLVSASLDAAVVGTGTCELVLATGGPTLDRRTFSSTIIPNFVPQQEISARVPVHLQSPIELATPNEMRLQCVTFSEPTHASLGLQARAWRMSAVSVGSITTTSP